MCRYATLRLTEERIGTKNQGLRIRDTELSVRMCACVTGEVCMDFIYIEIFRVGEDEKKLSRAAQKSEALADIIAVRIVILYVEGFLKN